MNIKDAKAKGLIIVFTGNGKGKTTAAMGMALRATGHRLKTLMIQFIKGSWHYGELEAVKKLNPYFEIVPMGNGFLSLRKGEIDPEDLQAIADAWKFSRKKIASGKYDMIILDEINYVISYHLLPVEEVLEVLRSKPKSLHLILTGRDADTKIVEIADLVTHMEEIKHPFHKGTKAQMGIEF
ncbi:MAG: cob(I)yrinic acid a,c-diamide adenosyltransferase [Deltaproteobacteria bacterium CG_4_8_14_3_um_filter_45_9]|nr:MAG: cob(I)yrinic acid a,c-diamide adenosyltransferase [Deltaproteobacteria bacterium CG03_land_8_20_14_0_80_45_14]PIX24982.1 MAG: cob(I)yrinic acid a,c-diamide adenosyltransferase [Deltaproteobacteria bacterium CG_4_8_14_3_um_filter_45_9]